MILGTTNLSLPVFPALINATESRSTVLIPSNQITDSYLDSRVLNTRLLNSSGPFSVNDGGSASSSKLLALINVHECPNLKTPFEEKAQAISKEDTLEIRTVIENQIEALRNGDFVRALSCAGPATQTQYSDLKAFAQVVKATYEPIFNSHSVVFEDAKEVMGLVTQPVLLLSANGDMVMASYLMEKLDNGEWKINGCYLAPIK